MSNSEYTTRFSLRRRWQALPLYIKLLIPIIVGLAVTIAIIVARVQSPIEALAQKAVHESFARQIEVLQDRLVAMLTDDAKAVNDVTFSPDLRTYIELTHTGDPGQLKRTQGLLGVLLERQLTAANARFTGLRSSAGFPLGSMPSVATLLV